MTTTRQNKLKLLYTRSKPGKPYSMDHLKKLGISTDLTAHYVRSGWLVRLAHGVYAKPNEELNLHDCLCFLEEQILGLHVGGKSALDWHGVRHYLSISPTLTLFGWNAAKLPVWFTDRFPARYHRKRLFKETPGVWLHIGRHDRQMNAPLVSSPERAFLEVLSEVGVRQPMQETRELAESTHNLRAAVLNELLKKCTSIKTIRLCLKLGGELSLPWLKKLDTKHLPIGSASRWVTRSTEGLLVLKP